MRWIVVGAYGMLGQDLVETLTSRGEQVLGVDRDTVDITDPTACAALGDVDVIVNCAAYTAVDAAEADEPAAFAINARGAANLARAAHAAGARIVQISTDYVFDGLSAAPYAEDAPIAPRSAYGRTKAAGEWAVRAECPDHIVLRTSWLYGARGQCFPSTIVRLAKERGTVDVIDDQVGQPTWTMDLADLVHRLIAAAAPAGTYHGTSAGQTSWYGFAREAVRSAGLDPDLVTPTSSAEYVRAATRPAFSVLGHGSLEAISQSPIGDWEERWAAAAAHVI